VRPPVQRALEAGVLRPGTGLVWARHVCHTLIHEADRNRSDEVDDADEPATLVVGTLLRGVGQQGSSLSP
jgi:hypothetical protein